MRKRSACRSRRLTSNTSRRKLMVRSTPPWRSSTTSQPTRSCEPPAMSTMPADASTRELTVDEAVAIAIQLQRREQLREAHELFRRVLDTVPDHPDALHYSGVLAHQQGRHTEAITLIERSLALVPDRADWHSNLGIVFQSEGRFEDAIARYRHAIELDPNHANAYNNLGVLLRATGRPAEAEAAYRGAIERNPSHVDAYTNLGILLNSLKRP